MSAPEDVRASVREAASRVAGSLGLDIFDVQVRRESIGLVVRVYIDRAGPVGTPDEGVSVADCERVSREMSAILDVEDLVPQSYTLEVSSPGLDRPLRGAADFARFTGRLAKVVVTEAVDGQKAFAGRLDGLDGDAVWLAAHGRRHRIPLALISRARLDVEF